MCTDYCACNNNMRRLGPLHFVPSLMMCWQDGWGYLVVNRLPCQAV